jgi:hypothetical protein
LFWWSLWRQRRVRRRQPDGVAAAAVEAAAVAAGMAEAVAAEAARISVVALAAEAGILAVRHAAAAPVSPVVPQGHGRVFAVVPRLPFSVMRTARQVGRRRRIQIEAQQPAGS